MPEALDEAGAFASATYARYGEELHRYLLRRLYRAQDAEDVVQEVFMRLLRVRAADLVRNPRAYVYGIALHVVREIRIRDERAGVWTTFTPEEITRQGESAQELKLDELPDRLDLQRRLTRALARLPAAHRSVFLMHKRDGYSYEEIAGKLGVSVHMVDKYLLEAKVRLRAEWVRE